MDWSTQTLKSYWKIYLGIENYGAIDLVSAKYVRINPGARYYRKIHLDIKNHGEINLDSKNYEAVDPDA